MIEEIMKPYFDKKEEIEKKQEINNQYLYERNLISIRLERLRDNKDREIEEYVQNAVSDRPDFYAGYGAMIRKDLEQAYIEKEQRLETEIKEIDNKIEKNSRELARYRRVDIRELTDVKHDLRKKLISARKELEIKLKEAQLRFDAVMYKLSTFKYAYDENHNVLNGIEYRKLFEESNALVEFKYNLQRDLKQVDEYLKVTELTEEETKTLMMSMTDVEKEEYNKRKKIQSIISSVEKLTSDEQFLDQQVVNKPAEENAVMGQEANVVVDEPKTEITDDDIVYEIARKGITEQEMMEENYSEFIGEISRDVLSSVKRLRSIKLEDGKYLSATNPGNETEDYEIICDSPEEKVELVDGLYLNKNDVSKALANYVRKNKGETFIVNGVDKTLTITKKSVKKVKEFLKRCSTIKLLSEKKLSTFDIKRVFGKDKAAEYQGEIELQDKKTKMPTGDYVLIADVYEAFKKLFVEKKPSWIESLKSKFTKVNSEENITGVLDADYEQLDFDNEGPEQEVVKVK